MKRKGEEKANYTWFKAKFFLFTLAMVTIAFFVISMLFNTVWRGKAGDWLVYAFQSLLKLDYQDALNLYQQIFRNNRDIILFFAVAVVFCVFFGIYISLFTRYFNEINRGIDALLDEDNVEIRLPTEMSEVEKKLNTVRQTLEKRVLEAQLAEQRKNDLVMYLAHDLRTPLTSIIGYLSLLDEAPDMPLEQKANYVHITLDKAYRLETLINEFFEITRYNLQEIQLEQETIDLYYMLVQLADEFYPILSAKGNQVTLHIDENLTIYGDRVKLARVFNNILKNASAYSYPQSELSISAKIWEGHIAICFENQGVTIPPHKLSAIFEKFYRLNAARITNTGGAGLGLAIAKEIVVLHGGFITAESERERTCFTVFLPIPSS